MLDRDRGHRAAALLVCTVLAWLSLIHTAAAGVPISTLLTTTYVSSNRDGTTQTRNLVYYKPTNAGTYPIFIFIGGSGAEDTYDDTWILEMLESMAGRGVVAASVQYDSDQFDADCTDRSNKADGIFDPVWTDNAVSRLVAHSGVADPAKGIATAGHSQGATIARAGRIVNANVRAFFQMGSGVWQWSGGIPIGGCTGAVPGTPQRMSNGDLDLIFGRAGVSVAYDNRLNLQDATGACIGTFIDNCLTLPDGGGYYLIRAADTGNSHLHSYPVLNASWKSTGAAWGREANLSWLYSKLTP